MDSRVRYLYYASIAVSGGVSLVLPAALGEIPVQGMLAAYAGLGIGIELGKLWARLRKKPRNNGRLPKAPDVDPLVVQVLRKLGFSAAEARYWASHASGETLEERVRSALQAAAQS
jgi:hypothetical protein